MLEIPGYSIEKELGHGGMAAVYLATQEFTQRKVAIKVMSPALAADPSFSERFLKEATCANLSHPNIVNVYDAGEINKQNYIVMEYASGGDLAQALSKGLTVYESVKVMKQIAAALAYAHERGYVHRDVKPDNILLRADGTAVLVDFGIAKASTTHTQMTQVGMTIGSPHYMSPEQARAKNIDGRSDLYSLGIVFYEMLTRDKPYDAEDTYAISYMHVNDPPPKLPAAWAYLQPTLDRMLAKDPADRFADANALLQALESVQPPPGPQRASLAATVLRGAEPAPPQKKSAAVFAVTLAGAGLALGALGFFYYSPSDAPPQVIAAITPTPPAPSVDPQTTERQRQAEQAAAEEVTRNEKISALLAQADTYMNRKALTKPPQANALASYRQVLALDSLNTPARDGVQRIASDIYTLAAARKTKGDMASALALVDEGLAVDAGNTQLRQLKNELGAVVAQRQKDIDSRLAKAAEFVAQGVLIAPANANAHAEYKSVLTLEAQNRRALQGIADITERVANEIERDLSEARLDLAQTKLSSARSVLGDAPKFTLLSTQLMQAKRDYQTEEQRRKDEQQRQAMMDEQRKMLEEIKNAQLDLAKAKAAPLPRTAAPNQLAMGDKRKIALVIRFLAGPKSSYPTDELVKKTGTMMKVVLADFVPEGTQFEVIDDPDISASMKTEGERAETSKKICAKQNADYTLGSLMEDTAGSPNRSVDLVLVDCSTGKRAKTSVNTNQDRGRAIKEALVPFLKQYVVAQR